MRTNRLNEFGVVTNESNLRVMRQASIWLKCEVGMFN